MTNGHDKQPATKGDLKALQKELKGNIGHLDSKIDKSVDSLKDDIVHWKDEILTSNDKVVKKLDQVLTEQKAITVNYKRVDQRVETLEAWVEQAAQKLQIEFERV